jgi:hypothetical protein
VSQEPIDILGGQVRTPGFVKLEPTPRGIVLHRLPAWAWVRHNDVALG